MSSVKLPPSDDLLDNLIDRAWTELTAPGGPFETTTVTVRGQALRTFRDGPRNVREFWLATTARGDSDYLVYGDERITYAQAHRHTAAVANWLQRHGVNPGDRVGIAMRNHPEWLLIYWACLSVGVVAVGLNAWWTAAEMAHALQDSAPKVVFCDAERLAQRPNWPQMPAMHVVAVRATAHGAIHAWDQVVRESGPLPDVDPDPDADAAIFYTSGTSGISKGARLTHRGCITNFLNMRFAAEVHFLAESRLQGLPPPAPGPAPVALVTTPLFHVTANNCQAYAVTGNGGTLVLMHKWDAGEALRLIEAERITQINGVPTMARELLRHAAAARRDIGSLGLITAGGAQMPPDLVGDVFASAPGRLASTGYGMTETCGIMTATIGKAFAARPDSCGRVMPSFEVRVVDDAGTPVPENEAGELCVKGASVIAGYLNHPQATREAIPDGWLHTGDIARIDDRGNVYILDRKKDMVLRGGENVYCAEVEAALYRHPAVAEACVFGVPDERLGEEVGAAIVLTPGATVTADALRLHLADWIARYKVPRYVWLLPGPLTRGATGKFLRRELRKALSLAHAA